MKNKRERGGEELPAEGPGQQRLWGRGLDTCEELKEAGMTGTWCGHRAR